MTSFAICQKSHGNKCCRLSYHHSQDLRPLIDGRLDIASWNTLTTMIEEPLSNVQYSIGMVYNEAPHKGSSFFPQLPYCPGISIGIRSNMLGTVAWFPDTGAGSNLIHRLFILRLRNDHFSLADSPNLRTKTIYAAHMNVIVKVFGSLGNWARAWI